MASENEFMSVFDAAAMLGVHVQTLRKLARQRKIPSLKVGRDWKFKKETLLRWGDDQQQASVPAPISNADGKTDGRPGGPRQGKQGPSIADSLDAVRHHMADHGHQVGAPLTDDEDRDLAARILTHVADPDHLRSLIKTVTLCLQKWLGCDAVGVRLRKGLDFPYYETRGFSDEFALAENSLCERDSMNELVRDSAGNPVLECMCGNIICGRFDPSKAFFTEHGSFWSNCTTELLATTTEEDRNARTRNRCNGEGYESVALFPLKTENEIHGLLQINDRRKGLFDREIIALLEQVAEGIAFAVESRQTHAGPTRDTPASRRLAGRNGVVVAGRSVLPAESSPSGAAATMILEMALDSATHRVLRIACDALPTLGQEMLAHLLVGKTLPGALREAKEGLTNGYYSELRNPVIAALEDVVRNYREIDKRDTGVDPDKPCSVLVIDDEEKICTALVRVVKQFGCRARQALDGAKGLELVAEDVPDLILLDLVMPGMNGPQFLEKLRETHPNLPVVIVTGHPDCDLMQQATQYAPVMLLSKPVDAALLERTVRTVAGMKMPAARPAGTHGSAFVSASNGGE